MGATYRFNRVRPPLLKDYGGDVYGVPSEALREVVGKTQWTETKPDNRRRGVVIKGQVQENRFELTRTLYWSLSLPPEHFAEDITKTVTVISGASETQRHTMERALEASSSASGFGLSASVKASLKITDETTREWHEERKEEREQVFKEGHTYCTWTLVDELWLERTTQSKYPRGGQLVPFGPALFTTARFSCIIGTYQDKWLDTEAREVSAEEFERQLKAPATTGRVVTLPTGRPKGVS